MEKKFESIEPSEIVKNIEIDDEPVIKEMKSDVIPVQLQDAKRKISSEIPNQDKIYFAKIGDNGKKYLLDFEADKQMIVSYGNIENLIRKSIVPLYGYGEYIPYTVEYDKDGKRIEKYGAPINIMKPITKSDNVNGDKESEYSKILSEVRNVISEIQRREDERRKSEEQRMLELIEKSKVKTDGNENLMAIVIQQMNNMMLFMMENMKKRESNNDIQELSKIIEPILNKIKSLEMRIEEKSVPILPDVEIKDKKEDFINLIKNIKDIIQPANSKDDSIINELKGELNMLRNENKQLQDKLLNSQIENMKKEIDNYKEIITNREDDIDKFLNMYDRLLSLSNKINPEKSGALDGMLQTLIEKVPEFITAASEADKLKVQQIINENTALRNKVNELYGILNKIKTKVQEKKKLAQQSEVKEKEDNQKKESSIVVKKISESNDNNGAIDKIEKIKVDNVVKISDNKKQSKKRSSNKVNILSKFVTNNVIENFNNAKNDDEIFNAIKYFIEVLMSNDKAKSYIISRIAMLNGPDDFRNFIIDIADKTIKNKVNNFDNIINCIAKNADKWYRELLMMQ